VLGKVEKRYLPVSVDHAVSRKQKTSFVEVYGLGKAKGLKRLFPAFLALSKRMLSIPPVVDLANTSSFFQKDATSQSSFEPLTVQF
jgi:hypothetical protein